jgi:hypothetical protein
LNLKRFLSNRKQNKDSSRMSLRKKDSRTGRAAIEWRFSRNFGGQDNGHD